MKVLHLARAGLALLVVLPTGCTAMRPLPRTEYAALEERRDVVVETAGGERIEFESVRVTGDTLTGWREREPRPEPSGPAGSDPAPDLPPELPEQRTLVLDQVTSMSVKRVDWRRTGAAIGVVVAGVLAYVLTRGGDEGSDGSDGPVKPPPTLGRR